MNISQVLARKIIINQQLNFIDHSQTAPDALETVFSHLGYIQIDTINVVKRAHHHTLWNRFGSYNESMLNTLQIEKKIFEYWGHAASYLPMPDYRYYLPVMKRFQNPTDTWTKTLAKECSNILEPTLQRIRTEGPLSVSDFKTSQNKISSGWGACKPAKKALELLFWQGKLMVKERRKFQKIYDLTENVIPDNIDTTFPTKLEVAQFLILKAIQAQGVTSVKEICSHINTRDKSSINTMLQQLIYQKKIVELTLENLKDPYYSTPEIVEKRFEEYSETVYILSPFDNLIINRNRLLNIFNFDYKLECYYPALKRKYGYFTLPLLYKDKFIGRIDCKSIRKEKILQIKEIFWEENSDLDIFLEPLAEALIKFADFNECRAISFQQKTSKELLSYLKKNYEVR